MDNTPKPKGHFRTNWNFYMLLTFSIFAISYMWYSQSTKIYNLEKSHELEMTALKVKADSLLQNQAELNQSLFTKTLAQAIRPMDTAQKTQYFDQLIKYKGIDEIAFEQSDKTINASTNTTYIQRSINESLDIQINYQNTGTQSFFKLDKNIICHPVIIKGKIEGIVVTVFPITTI